MNSQTCNKCYHTKPLLDFNQYKVKSGYKHYAYCKKCHNNNRKYTKKTTGFLKLPIDERKQIMALYQTIPLKTIAQKFDLKYTSLLYWNKTRQLTAINCA
jgi:hypothetical protein